MPSSILIFEINKKILLYKILTDELLQLLKTEIVKNFGSNYVIEKNEQKTAADENDTSATEKEDNTDENKNETKANPEKNLKNNNNAELNLTNDLIYEYFSPIVASFEISKDINYTYEYALFNKNQQTIRFYLYNNCLIMCILSNTATNKLNKSDSELTRLVYAEYQTSWYCKSFISLIRYKFGICSDERCFTGLNQIDIKRLYQKWSYLHANDPVFYIEAIEQLQINEDIKIKCEIFLNDLVQFLFKAETIMSEFDFMDEGLRSSWITNDEIEDSIYINNDIQFQNDEENQKNIRFNELEAFFTDLGQINQFIMSCGSKLLFKFKFSTDSNENKSAFSIDSSSVFMLLLEATSFLDCTLFNPFDVEEIDAFKSVSSSPVARSLIESEGDDMKKSRGDSDNPLMINSLIDNFQSVYSTPPIKDFSKMSMSDSYKTEGFSFLPTETSQPNTSQDPDIELDLKKVTKFKKTNCFLKTTNRTLGFYEILLLKLSDNLCLTMIKTSKLTKYCELISDFDTLIVSFIDLLNRKRLQLSSAETDSSLNNDLTDQLETIKSPSKQNRERQSDRIDKAFFSFFMNKLIYLFDKLKQLKNELNDTNSKEKTGIFNGAFRFQKSRNVSSSSLNRFNRNITKEEIMKRNSVKLIHAIQFKMNQLTNSKQFKQLAGFINSDQTTASTATDTMPKNITDASNEMLSNLRNIEAQINAIRLNITELFSELFLVHSNTISDELESYDKLAKNHLNKSDNSSRSSSNSGVGTILFKSAYLVDNVKELYKKHIYHYTPYMEVKWRRNTSMSFFWNLYSGLIHFSFINRQDNLSFIPTIDECKQYNLDEYRINLAYRKYTPIVFTFFTRFQCTQFQFTDDKLNLVFSYLIWFEDKKSNYLPVDFDAAGQSLFNTPDYFNSKLGKNLFEQNSTPQFSLNLPPLVNSTEKLNKNQLSDSPGITNKNNYDSLQAICYPNAISNSLICYELYCIHTPQLDEEKIKLQLSSLMSSLSKRAKNGSFEFG